MSVTQTILRSARGRGRGTVFTAGDFKRFGTRGAIDQALSRLTKAGKIRRIAWGVYDLPQRHPRIGPLSPSPEAVAKAVARRTRSRLQPTGPAAANRLGLSTQVPARTVYWTDGPSRRVKVGRLPVELRHTSGPRMLFPGTTAGLVIVALHYLGRGGVTQEMVRSLSEGLSEKDKMNLELARPLLRGWLGSTIDQVLQE